MLQPICNGVLQCCVFVVYFTITLIKKIRNYCILVVLIFHTALLCKRAKANQPPCEWMVQRRCHESDWKYSVAALIEGCHEYEAYTRFDLTAFIVVIQFNWIFIFSSYFDIVFFSFFIRAAIVCNVHQITYRIKCDVASDSIWYKCVCIWSVWICACVCVLKWTSALNIEPIQLNILPELA